MSLSVSAIIKAHDIVNNESRDTEIKSRIECANFLMPLCGYPTEKARTEADALIVFNIVLHGLLNTEQYQKAAIFCWGTSLFDPRPYFVQKIWHVIRNYNKWLIMGCGAGGKTFTTCAFDLLDWSRDPYYTTIKYISTTAGHARAQSFSLLVRFHRASIVPLPGYIRQGFIGMDKDDRRSSISELAIDKGSELEGKSGKLQGFHPLPRKKEHPIFGKMSRVRARLDEAEDVPVPVWPGLTNMMLTMGDDKSVSVGGMFNPKRRDSAVAQRAEPMDGWGNFDPERDEEWESKKGFHVLRLDGKKCENVIQKKNIYHGLITFEGYNQYPPEHPDHATFSRGMYPTQSMAFNIISQSDLDQSIGTFIWSARFKPYNWATLDSAFEADGDAATMTAGMYGEAIGFLPQGRPPISFKSPKWVIQYEQQFDIAKGRTQMMAKNVMKICRALHVTPEWFAMDRTGNATGLCDLLYDWGDILGIQWGEKATEVKILEEDSERAVDLYDDVITEMFFSFSAWLQFGYIAFSPGMETTKVFSQLSSRKYRRTSRTKRRIESKDDYRKRLSAESPNEADSTVMGTHLIRLRAPKDQVHAMEPEKRYVERENDYFREGAIHTATSESEIDRMEQMVTD